ncbi:hypothetical protein J6590_055070 [Homalodisca vitripennis]|nr:hypothetical protein J6590_055070 [Homalodisca vitripennis]
MEEDDNVIDDNFLSDEDNESSSNSSRDGEGGVPHPHALRAHTTLGPAPGADDEQTWHGHDITRSGQRSFRDTLDNPFGYPDSVLGSTSRLQLKLHNYFNCTLPPPQRNNFRPSPTDIFCILHKPKTCVSRSYDELRNHFRQEHYLCEEGECYEEKFTSVFRTDIDLKAHRALVHGRQMTKAAAKQARTLELAFTLKPRPRQAEQRRAGGRGNSRYHRYNWF